ncbi:peptidase S41 [Pseudoalteromonas sp. JBTF-M23]|uniref:Peptidase S41 n=1 Tax=Pseudoalteromonas caenipelagi TaxID=2726988 RepID=A0A849VBF7_9GAMM|nr:peptidase S41 [Pseudoalteromonas caenipelagi]
MQQIQADLTQIPELINAIHPDSSHSIAPLVLRQRIDELSKGVKSPMTELEAWRHLSQLNPYFQDAHFVITYPNIKQRIKQHLKNGGKLFPLKVYLDDKQRLRVQQTYTQNRAVKANDEIISINGVSSIEVVNSILSRMHGDTERFRKSLASKRFSQMFWLLYGDSGSYAIEILHNNKVLNYSLQGTSTYATDVELVKLVDRKILKGNIGYLKVDRFIFVPEQEKAFFDFISETWSWFKHKHVKDVIIDVRENQGGTDHYWQLGIAPYIAQESFPFLSHFKIRLTERNLKLGPVQGEQNSVLEGPYNQRVPVDKHRGLKIDGNAYLMIGPRSYSSTLLFLTAIQDAKQGIIVGESNGARSCTTGRVESRTLTETGLLLTVPSLIFTRPSGSELCSRPIVPDLRIEYDDSQPEAQLNQLVDYILQHTD